jgi:hypothetical protein
MSEGRRIPLTAIVVDLAIQQRARGTSEDVVNEYAEAMRNGDKFPAVVVFSNDDRTFYLADGFHRIDAYRLAHCDVLEIECEVHHGNREDALVFGCSANSGLDATRLTNGKPSRRFSESVRSGPIVRLLAIARSPLRLSPTFAKGICKRRL